MTMAYPTGPLASIWAKLWASQGWQAGWMASRLEGIQENTVTGDNVQMRLWRDIPWKMIGITV